MESPAKKTAEEQMASFLESSFRSPVLDMMSMSEERRQTAALEYIAYQLGQIRMLMERKEG